jgi:signal transduction histidine kinase
MRHPEQPARWNLLARFHQRTLPGGDAPLRRAVADEQLNMVLDHTRLGSLVATAFAVFFALQLRGEELPAPLVDGWLAVKLAVAGWRFFRGLAYQRQGRPGGAAWRRSTDIWLLVDGIVWGVAGLTLMAAPVPLASLAGAVMACVTSVATFGLQFSKRSTAAYVAPILALTALGLFLRADEFGTIGGTGLLMLLGLLLATSMASEKRLVDGLLLRLRAQALSVEKDEALKAALREKAVRTQFLSSVSHELRTPLHGILGLARLLHLEAGDDTVARRVELIESSGVHLLGLVNDLLDISRLEAGRLVMRHERFELVSQVKALADIYTVRAEDKGLRFSVALGIAGPCWVLGDPARLRQVLHNLLGNAVKFTSRGSVSLTLGRDTAGGQFTAEVTDTGPGIANEDLEHVFEAFRQLDGANQQPSEGAGLGLTIARDIAQAMGGDITLRSTLGAGTTVLLTASLPDAPAAGELAPASTSAPAAMPSPRRVLIAEDDEVNALIATAYLEHFGIECERVADGRQAVRHALREVDRPDLVLMDCRMPVMDGLQATREIRAQERTLGLQRIPVIALTATASNTHRDQCMEAGMDDFMAKPYTRAELAAMLERWAGVGMHAVTAATR